MITIRKLLAAGVAICGEVSIECTGVGSDTWETLYSGELMFDEDGCADLLDLPLVSMGGNDRGLWFEVDMPRDEAAPTRP